MNRRRKNKSYFLKLQIRIGRQTGYTFGEGDTFGAEGPYEKVFPA